MKENLYQQHDNRFGGDGGRQVGVLFHFRVHSDFGDKWLADKVIVFVTGC